MSGSLVNVSVVVVVDFCYGSVYNRGCHEGFANVGGVVTGFVVCGAGCVNASAGGGGVGRF